VPDDNDMTTKKSRRGAIGRAWRMEGRSARRRRIVHFVIVAVVALVLVVIPTYIALQPSFIQRYPNLGPEYKAWSTSVHAEVPCQRCHVQPGIVPQTVYAGRMLGEFYLSLVSPGRQPTLFAKPTNASCQSCHIDLRTVSPSGDLNIPHRAHVVVLKMQCIQCHTYLVHKANPEGTHTPRMETCLKCHNGVVAKGNCSTCHTNKGEPVSHRAADWVVVHPQMQSKIDCAKCHAWTPNWCATCHQRRPGSHKADWRLKHGAAVKTHRNCEACHEAAFCIKCHGDVPKTNYNPSLKLVK
jgi:hypothetical protein